MYVPTAAHSQSTVLTRFKVELPQASEVGFHRKPQHILVASLRTVPRVIMDKVSGSSTSELHPNIFVHLLRGSRMVDLESSEPYSRFSERTHGKKGATRLLPASGTSTDKALAPSTKAPVLNLQCGVRIIELAVVPASRL